MSLPLTRRIARAALLIAAGAAPVVGAAGSACAATTDLPATPNLGGLTTLDGAQVGNVDGAAQKVTGLAGTVGGKAVPQAVRTAAPVAQKAAGDAAGHAGGLLGGLPAQQLPLQGMPLGG